MIFTINVTTEKNEKKNQMRLQKWFVPIVQCMQSQPWFWQLTVIIIVDLAISLYQDTILWGVAHWRSKIRCKCRAEKKIKVFFWRHCKHFPEKRLDIYFFVCFQKWKANVYQLQKISNSDDQNMYESLYFVHCKKKFGNISLDRHFSKTTKHTSWVLFAIRRYP